MTGLEGVEFDGDTPLALTTVRGRSASLALLFGGDPAVAEPRYSLTTRHIECPVVVPVKRRGLTGKAYRSARRHYHRQMRDYRRGKIRPHEILTYVPNVTLRSVEQVPGSNSLSLRFGVR